MAEVKIGAFKIVSGTLKRTGRKTCSLAVIATVWLVDKLL
jgi:hypothetical protein